MTYTVDGNQYIGVAGGSTIMTFGLPAGQTAVSAAGAPPRSAN
jgi:hypothetical protein